MRRASEQQKSAEATIERIMLAGPNVRLTPKAAVALGIGFHALATNAAKYGAFSNQAGSISLT